MQVLDWIIENWDSIGLALALVVSIMRGKTILSALVEVMGKLEGGKNTLGGKRIVDNVQDDCTFKRVPPPVAQTIQTIADIVSGRKVKVAERARRFILGRILRRGIKKK